MTTPSALAHATEEGTARFRDRHSDRPGNFRHAQGLWFSSIGLGTYLGASDAKTDAHYASAIVRAVELGINVIDTAANYRHQRSERAIGTALKRLFKTRKARRDEIVIATKGGYLPFDGDLPDDRDRYIRETFVDTGLTTPAEIVGGNCLSPNFLRAMIDQSLHNLRIDSIDIYYLHNPEAQLNAIDRQLFRERLCEAFKTLEEAVDEGVIHYYGLATWDGLRVEPTHINYLLLADVMTVARKVRGMRHHCRFIQLPFNLVMPEALTHRNQMISHESMTVLEAAARLGLTVMSSASLLQGQLVGHLPDDIPQKFNSLNTDAQRCLQFVRSTPGITTALAGMSNLAHVEENLATLSTTPLSLESYQALFA